ncbi:ubiquinone anaerobic biosynthesis accessory factor UbiT [Saccharospirillum salsuginis]|uniref:SCP2 domain-containing protein n=1 Tax=Saccharospirillum salsuginis TaxID=418750 RepID=A0A918KJJ2_9GAMM|nr:SCP2 sterol-binding domain-containing protein [Saccharospirillum salsuginis]GGX66268.1 SCP2 domain-containing protein [Saccharospirillum salsuginis]
MHDPAKHQYPKRAIKFTLRQFLSKCPSPVFHHSAELFLNHTFKSYIDNAELDFLEGKHWKIDVSDAPRALCITLLNRRIKVTPCTGTPDLTFKGPIASFVTLALKEEDPDGLFFNRKLMITGDTALGLEIKNFIDRMPLEDILKFPMSTILNGLDKVFNADQSAQHNGLK